MNVIVMAGSSKRYAIYNNPHEKPVYQMNLNGQVINRYDSAKQASDVTGVHGSSISQCCSGKIKKAGGYLWKWAEKECLKTLAIQKDKPYYVYKHTNTINGKVYIGYSCQRPVARWGSDGRGYKRHGVFYSAIQEYGWNNFAHEILAEHLTGEEARELEKYWIQYYHSQDEVYGYNQTEGGESAIVICQYDLNGNYIRTYESIIEAERQTGARGLSNRIKSETGFCGGYLWRAYDNVSSENVPRYIDPHWKQVDQYDLDGKYICTYDSISVASEILGISGSQISTCCSGKTKAAGGYMWRYHDQQNAQNIDRYTNKIYRSIDKLDLNGKYICSYPTISEAARANGCKKEIAALSECARGKRKSAGGFIWRYSDENHGQDCEEYKNSSAVAVDKFDLNGRFLCSYPSITAAEQDLGLPKRSGINHALKGKHPASNGFMWRYHKDGVLSIPPFEDSSKKAVLQFNELHQFIAKYASIKDASIATGISRGAISSCCRKKTKTAGGYAWEFAIQASSEETI